MSRRDQWIEHLHKVVRPILEPMANGDFTQIPVQGPADRQDCTALEALGRIAAGVGPWSAQDTGEGNIEIYWLLRSSLEWYFSKVAHKEIPLHRQNLIDLGYLAMAGLPFVSNLMSRGTSLLELVQGQFTPLPNNWILMEAVANDFFHGGNNPSHPATRCLAEAWYKGDGVYGDGQDLQFDYYNSLVIHPALLHLFPEDTAIKQRAARYCQILERMISPTATFPSVGRSASYRMGVFFLFGIAAEHGLLSDHLSAKISVALTAMLDHFKDIQRPDGYLSIGFVGPNAELGEPYISTGSLYAHCLFLRPLALPKAHAFWSVPTISWTQKCLWGGLPVARDVSLGDPLPNYDYDSSPPF